MHAVDLVTLVAVGTVVLLVSLPCLRDFAVRENERDALRLLPILCQQVHRPVHAADSDLGQVLERAPRLIQGLRDAQLQGDGARLEHHGYVFRLGLPDAEGQRAVLAWPVEHERTGLRSFAALPGGDLLEHANPEGRWSGELGPDLHLPELTAGWLAAGWSPAEPGPEAAREH